MFEDSQSYVCPHQYLYIRARQFPVPAGVLDGVASGVAGGKTAGATGAAGGLAAGVAGGVAVGVTDGATAGEAGAGGAVEVVDDGVAGFSD